jgi:hypothetical protein
MLGVPRCGAGWTPLFICIFSCPDCGDTKWGYLVAFFLINMVYVGFFHVISQTASADTNILFYVSQVICTQLGSNSSVFSTSFHSTCNSTRCSVSSASRSFVLSATDPVHLLSASVGPETGLTSWMHVFDFSESRK